MCIHMKGFKQYLQNFHEVYNGLTGGLFNLVKYQVKVTYHIKIFGRNLNSTFYYGVSTEIKEDRGSQDFNW